MIEYSISDALGNEFPLNDDSVKSVERGSFTFSDDSFSFENRIVENSALPGAVKLGKTRIESRTITLAFDSVDPSSSEFRQFHNNLIYQLLKAEYFLDKTNGLRIKIALGTYSTPYDSGGHKLSSSVEITLILLNPYWEAITETEISQALTADINTIGLNNLGLLDSAPTLEFTAAVAVTSIQAYIDETKIGIEILDTLFGTVGYPVLLLDCINGALTLGEFDRSQNITAGTGFFVFPVGVSSLKIIPDAVCDVIIKYRKRVYI